VSQKRNKEASEQRRVGMEAHPCGWRRIAKIPANLCAVITLCVDNSTTTAEVYHHAVDENEAQLTGHSVLTVHDSAKKPLTFKDGVPDITQMYVWHLIINGRASDLLKCVKILKNMHFSQSEIDNIFYMCLQREFSIFYCGNQNLGLSDANVRFIATMNLCDNIDSMACAIEPITDADYGKCDYSFPTLKDLHDFKKSCDNMRECILAQPLCKQSGCMQDELVNPIHMLLQTCVECFMGGMYTRKLIKDNLYMASMQIPAIVDSGSLKSTIQFMEVIEKRIGKCIAKALKLHERMAHDIIIPIMIWYYTHCVNVLIEYTDNSQAEYV
jgi:hypothetical protein